ERESQRIFQEFDQQAQDQSGAAALRGRLFARFLNKLDPRARQSDRIRLRPAEAIEQFAEKLPEGWIGQRQALAWAAVGEANDAVALLGVVDALRFQKVLDQG